MEEGLRPCTQVSPPLLALQSPRACPPMPTSSHFLLPSLPQAPLASFGSVRRRTPQDDDRHAEGLPCLAEQAEPHARPSPKGGPRSLGQLRMASSMRHHLPPTSVVRRGWAGGEGGERAIQHVPGEHVIQYSWTSSSLRRL